MPTTITIRDLCISSSCHAYHPNLKAINEFCHAISSNLLISAVKLVKHAYNESMTTQLSQWSTLNFASIIIHHHSLVHHAKDSTSLLSSEPSHVCRCCTLFISSQGKSFPELLMSLSTARVYCDLIYIVSASHTSYFTFRFCFCLFWGWTWCWGCHPWSWQHTIWVWQTQIVCRVGQRWTG